MRILAKCLLCCLLLACGSDDETLPSIQVEQAAVITNNYVQCGSFSQTADEALPRSLSAPSDWVVMGSSSAVGAGASTFGNSWVGLLQTDELAEDVRFHNIARGGYATYQSLSSSCVVAPSRRQPDPEHNIDLALSLGADLVILSFPSNDAALGYAASETAANILLLRQQLADKNAALLVLSSQPRNMEKDKQALLKEMNALLAPVLTDCFVDVYDALVGPDGGLSPQYDAGDGVHLNDIGHALVFEEVKSSLQSKRCVDTL